MAEIPANEYLHRSIDQLRSMNERGVLGSLGHLTTTDLRASLVHEYKPFSINELRQNVVERMDYSTKNNLLDRPGSGNPNGGSNIGQQQNIDNGTNNSPNDEMGHEHPHVIQQSDLKQSYSPPSSPPSPLSEGQMHETKIFTPKSEMIINNHPMQMRDTKPYKCTQCTKTFANSSYLSQHTRIHLGIKPYRCEICQRKFTQLSHLQQHIRTHTGDKPYKCRHPGCQKAFSQLSNLQSHSRCHQTDKPYKCNSCYKCFTDEQTLLEHIPKHKDSKHLKTHICNLCGKSYTQETYLQKHLQKHAEKAEKQTRNNSNNSGTVLAAAGLGLNLNRNIAMNVAAVAAAANGEHPYWPKVSPGSAAVSLAEAIQQQHQQQQQQQQHNGYDFSISQQQQNELQAHQRTVLEHHRVNGSNGDGQNDDGEDLVINRQTSTNNNSIGQHLSNEQQQQGSPNTIVVVSSTPNGNYEVANIAKTTSNSAFTPINTVSPHLNALGHHSMTQRPYIYDAIQFQTKNVNQAAANFPNQLISLHQIRNYTHQPGASGIIAGDHLLGIGVAAGGKEKVQ